MSEQKERVFRILTKEKRSLPVRLTEPEFRAKAKRLGQIAAEIAGIDNQIEGMKAQRDSLKASKEALDVERVAVSRVINTEHEQREVEVVIEVEDATNTVYERRTDTNEILKDRPLSAQEAQISMFQQVREGRPEDPPPSETKALPAPEGKKKRSKKKKAKDATVEVPADPDIGDLDAADEEPDADEV